ncbi:MAG: UrcA family protein [Sphingopyxis sp.]|uniref:UrcA family protein n=1 Tax=Sphingopyxis sp. TaxID=1908224 RepID=UPI001A35764C|nr:UrcA family protein [Sphingopyxis sp.]MBJ7500489.1 UrcA family protein [Sphingopyxis sp.]
MMTRTLILALSLTAAAVPAAAQVETETAAVRIDDLDLSRATGRERLDTRLKSAARSICQTGARGAAENSRRAACVSAALAQAEPQTRNAIAQAERGTRLALLMIGTAR